MAILPHSAQSTSPKPLQAAPIDPHSPSFRERFRDECIQGSAIDASLYAAAISFIEDTGRWETHEALNWQVHTQWQTRKPHDFGVLACLRNEPGFLWQAKPEKPRLDPKKGSPQKYETPREQGSRAFLPAIPLKVWKKICKQNRIREEAIWLEDLEIAARNNALDSLLQKWSASGGNPRTPQAGEIAGQGFSSSCSTRLIRSQALASLQKLLQPNTQELHSLLQGNPTEDVRAAVLQFVASLPSQSLVPSFWRFIANHPEIPIVFTEGAKKSLSLLSHGYCAIALYGVNGGYRANLRIGGEVIPLKQPELIDDLKPFIVPGRPIVLAFDQDAKATTRQKVNKALLKFGGLLEQRGSIVRIAEWDGTQGKGIDDLIVAAGLEAWEQSHTEALTFGEWRALYALQQQLTRKPDLHIGDRGFLEVADQLPRSGLVALWGGKATEKTKTTGMMLTGRSWVSITPLQSLGRDQAASWGGVFINDGDLAGERLLKDGQPVDGASVCIPSLCKVSRLNPEVVVIDELTAGLKFLLGSPLANRQGIRPVLLAEFARLVQSARLVVVADADLSEAALRHIEELRGERAYLIKTDRKANQYDGYLIDGSLNEAIAMLQARVEGLEPNQLIAVHCDSKSQAEALARLLGERQTLLITSETSGGDCEQDFLTSKGRLIPDGVRFIVCSPSVTQGFSIEHHTDLYDSVWGFYGGASIAAEDIAQSLERVRANVPRFIHCNKKGSAYSRLSKAETLGAFLRDFQRVSTAAARLVRHSLTPEAIEASDRIDWQSSNLKMLASLETRRNRGMRALRDTLSALLRHEGKRVQYIRATVSQAEARAAGQALKGAREALKAEYAQAIAAAQDLTLEQAKQLETLEALTPEQGKALEKFHLAQFYRIQEVTEEDVSFDHKGRTRRAIKALEAILNEEIAMQRTVTSIEESPGCPQDWDRTQVKRWLLEQSGAGQLIRDICTGEIEVLASNITGPIVAFIRAHQQEFRLAFGFQSISKMTDQQVIGEVLSAHGIRTKRNQRKGIYKVDKSHLERILGIVEARQKAVSPLPNLKGDQRGDTASDPLQISDLSVQGRGAIDDFADREGDIDGGFYEYLPESA